MLLRGWPLVLVICLNANFLTNIIYSLGSMPTVVESERLCGYIWSFFASRGQHTSHFSAGV